MPEYISREAVSRIAHEIYECRYEPDKLHIYCDQLRRIPTADVAPVVRCNDCFKKRICAWFYDGATFCSYGVRDDAKEGKPDVENRP